MALKTLTDLDDLNDRLFSGSDPQIAAIVIESDVPNLPSQLRSIHFALASPFQHFAELLLDGRA